ncbi:MAG: T9SS type A sorting domain-containing protein [Bacteroidetes bacterium]|nr:T9SS type A sorting domain-containing protein [Bacteroidota bacterium]
MKLKLYLISGLLIFFAAGNLFSQGFNAVHTPDGINVIAVGDSGKIYRSTNAGSSWASYRISTDNLKSVFSFGNDVWIGASNGNVYKTTKSNTPVAPYNTGSTATLNCVYFINGNTGYACGDAGSLYRTINGGLNWTISNSGITFENLKAVSFSDENNGVAVATGGKIFITTNAGSDWTATTGITANDLLDVKYFNDGIIAVGTNGTILTKENAGSWNTVVTRTESDIRGITGSSLNNARVCGGGGFIRNNLNSRSNFFNFEINPMMADLVDIFYYDASTGFAVSSLNNAIIRTTNGGQSWDLPSGTSVSYNWVQKTPSGSGIGNNLCMHPKNKNSAFVVYGNKVYVSRDRSETWTQIATISIGTRAHSFYVSPNDTNIWLAAMESSPDCIVRSTNYGATWTNVIAYDFSTYGQPLEMDQNNPSTFYFAPSNGSGIGVYKSTNDGANFSLISAYNNSAINQPCDLIVMWDSSNVLYMGDDGADIFKSTNYGFNWVQVKPGSSSEVPSMCNSVFDKSICYATTWSSSQVFKTSNYGDSWNITSNNSGSGWGSDLCREDPTLVLTGNYGSQAYLTTNGGANFFNVNTGLGGAGAGIMVPERGYMLNMQTSSLYKLKITYTILTNVNENTVSYMKPEGYELSQNYPNPFNPSTNIKFSLPDAGNISLKVYDQLGKEVSSLAEGFRNAGTYEINFNAANLSSGIFFYKLVTNDISLTKKMILIK